MRADDRAARSNWPGAVASVPDVLVSPSIGAARVVSMTAPAERRGTQWRLLWGDCVGGMSGALIVLPTILSCGVVAYQSLGPDYTTLGIGAAFSTAILVALVQFVFGGPPLHVNSPKTPLAVMLSGLIASVGATPFLIGAPDRGLLLITVASLSVVVCGLIQLGVGVARLGQIVRYLPYPVIAGFLNGVAIQIALDQLPHVFGLPAMQDFLQVFDGTMTINPFASGFAALAAVLTVAGNRIGKRLPSAVLALVVATLAQQIAGYVIAPATLGPVVGSFSGGVTLLPPLSRMATVVQAPGFAAIAGMIATTGLALAAINTVQSIMNLTAGDLLFGKRHNSNRELLVQGAGNVLAGLVGGVSSGGSILNTSAVHASGGRTRMTNLVHAAALALAALALSGPIGLVPLSVMSAVVLTTVVGAADRWTHELLRRTILERGGAGVSATAVDLLLVALVTALVLTSGTGPALALGIAVSSIVFLWRASRRAIGRVYTGDQVRSRTGRSHAAEMLLAQHGARIAVVEVQGPLFFGTTPAVEAAVDRAAAGARVVILDFRRVNMLDTSGVLMVRQLDDALQRRSTYLLLSSLAASGPGARQLRAVGYTRVDQPGYVFDDIDSALHRAEDILLSELGPVQDADHELGLADFELIAGFAPDEVRQLGQHATRLTLPAGSVLIREGDVGQSLFLLAQGRAIVTTADGRLRLAAYERGAVFGEMAIITGARRNATVTAETDVVVLRIAAGSIEALAAISPCAGMLLMRNIARIQSVRVQDLNKAVRALSA
jgi:SulP family sulfate permease